MHPRPVQGESETDESNSIDGPAAVSFSNTWNADVVVESNNKVLLPSSVRWLVLQQHTIQGRVVYGCVLT